MFLEMEGIRLIEGDVWGHRKDINEYYSISPSVNERIKELKSEGMSDEEIARKIEKEGKLNKDILLYILDKQ
jgi:ribosome-binding protein aMBF1 (putative translation factor)